MSTRNEKAAAKQHTARCIRCGRRPRHGHMTDWRYRNGGLLCPACKGCDEQ